MDTFRKPRGGRPKLYQIVILIVCGAVAIAIAVLYLADSPEPLDERLCPAKSGPSATTVLLLDTSDPLTPKHRAGLGQLAQALKANPTRSKVGLQNGEEIIVYQLADAGKLEPAISICKPGKDPADRTLRDELTQGKMFAMREWRQFEQEIEKLFPEETGAEQDESPLLEALAVLAPRHGRAKLEQQPAGKERLLIVVFSDLLQHSERLSHYRGYPPAKEAGRAHRALMPDLTGADVVLLRLEREKYRRWQTRDHYYWWTELVGVLGGRVVWQDSL